MAKKVNRKKQLKKEKGDQKVISLFDDEDSLWAENFSTMIWASRMILLTTPKKSYWPSKESVQ